MKRVAKSISLATIGLVVAGCAASNRAPGNSAAVSAAPGMATTEPDTVVGHLMGTDLKPAVARPTDAKRLATLRANQDVVERYLEAVDNQIAPLIKETIPHMKRYDWRRDIKQGLNGPGYHATIWDNRAPKANKHIRWFGVHVLPDNGTHRLDIPVFPNFWIRKPALDMRFDFYVHLENPKLEDAIRKIAQREAENL